VTESSRTMWLLLAPSRRTPAADLGMGVTTALVAGLVNVCSVMLFFAFSANVTGHAATLSEELVKGHWYQVWVVLMWMALFLVGAFVANLLVTRLGARSLLWGHGGPLLLQLTGLCAVAHYGAHHYLETLWETELLIGVLLLSMGLQNGTVSSVSNCVVRTTHLTGLFTDLGMELSQLLRKSTRQDRKLRERFTLHASILLAYIVGGVAGGLACRHWGFGALYLACVVLLGMLMRDLVLLRGHSAEPSHEASAATQRPSRAQALMGQ
jgi:uncharacterized membrane protein YoaK (UPF0700 family)